MITKFDKIYVITLVNNKERQEFISKQFNDLGINFEFMYSTDFKNIKYGYSKFELNWPEMFIGDPNPANTFSCAVAHYQSILQAYEFGYNNIMCIEDDLCLIKDKDLIEYYLNNIPDDADFITYDPRFINENEYNKIFDNIKKSNNEWILLNNDIDGLIGSMMYGIMNRNTMQFYLESQRNSFTISDSVYGIFRNPTKTIKRYTTKKCICTDHYNIENKFNTIPIYHNIYKNIENLSIESFNIPEKFSSFTR